MSHEVTAAATIADGSRAPGDSRRTPSQATTTSPAKHVV